MTIDEFLGNQSVKEDYPYAYPIIRLLLDRVTITASKNDVLGILYSYDKNLTIANLKQIIRTIIVFLTGITGYLINRKKVDSYEGLDEKVLVSDTILSSSRYSVLLQQLRGMKYVTGISVVSVYKKNGYRYTTDFDRFVDVGLSYTTVSYRRIIWKLYRILKKQYDKKENCKLIWGQLEKYITQLEDSTRKIVKKIGGGAI